ncbi:hypothetical protein [Paenibacillus sp. RUD330]|uniref:hypothetical protein n=1 Tax=Paenibacillus sp. RUD330 TaxID=2023772 RepID=UPI000B92A436|nr:hypothetical protein [Paenibacillus sp. RUD330]ASS66564.1 hypothetical protein CIC07_10630 [Paenibacillus sp. RUD330]
MAKTFRLNEWGIRSVRYVGEGTALIELHIPGINQQDKVIVRRGIRDALLGRTLEEKLRAELQKQEERCKRENEKTERMEAMVQRVAGNRYIAPYHILPPPIGGSGVRKP